MSASKRRVEGYDYLYQRGHSYEVRLQVPRPLRPVVGKGELKKSLGGDFAKVRKSYHRTVAELASKIDAARTTRALVQPAKVASTTPDEATIKAACYQHFQRMSQKMAGKIAIPVRDENNYPPNEMRKPATRQERAESFRQMLEYQARLEKTGMWRTMGLDAQWLCEEHGWVIDESSELFDKLCKMMMQVRTRCYENELRLIEGTASDDPAPDPLFDMPQPQASKRPTTLGDLITKFRAAREVNWSTSTDKNYVIIFRVIEEICGKDTPLTSIDNDFCLGLRDHLMKVPSNYQKRPATRGKSLVEAMEIGAREGIPAISPATVNSHLNKLGAILRYGRDQGWITGNPMAKVEVKDPVADEDKRDPFKVHQLNAIFACEPWASGPGGDAAMDRPSRYWAPLVSLYSGARLTEICGQLVSEMIEEGGVRLFDFRHRPGVRDMKNDKSRKVPVHPELIRLGFWDFVEEARASKRDLLFPDVSRNKLGNWGDPTSKWFGRLINKLGLTGRALCFHSFRHSFEDALKEIDLHDTPLGNVFTGRVSPGVSKNYGSRYTVKKLAEAMEWVKYEGLTLPPVMLAEGRSQCAEDQTGNPK